MAEGGAEGTKEEGTEDSKKKSNKTFIYIGIGVVVVIIILGALYLFLSKKQDVADKDLVSNVIELEPELVEEGYEDGDDVEEEEHTIGAMFPLETLVVNLSGGGFLRAQIQVEFVDKSIPYKFLGRLVQIQDALITLASTKRKEDILTSNGKKEFKEEIKKLIEEIIGSNEVANIYFTQFVVK